MWKNYLLIGYRSLLRNRTYTFINIAGLTLAISALLLSVIYTRYELTYDTTHEKIDRIYQVNRDYMNRHNKIAYTDFISTYFKEKLLPQIPGIEKSVHLRKMDIEIRSESIQLEQNVLFAGPEISDIFTIPFVRGDESALQDPGNIWITQNAVLKFFPDEDPIGKSIVLIKNGQEFNLLVAGVIKKLPPNSTLQYDFIAPFKLMADYYDTMYTNSWNMIFSQTYVLLDKNSSVEELQNEFDKLTVDENFCEIPEERRKPHYRLQNYSTLHIHFWGDKHIISDVEPVGLMTTVGISLIILILACINFTTLTMGRLSTRMREVGIRKVLGSSVKSIRALMLVETFILTLVAFLPALSLADMVLPHFSNLTSTELSLKLDLINILIIAGIITSVVLIAGFYPSIIMSRFGIINSLKGTGRYGGKGYLRRILVFIQISTSLALVTITLIMYAQYNFVMKTNLGYDSEYLISIDASAHEGMGSRALTIFRDKFANNVNIKGISASAATFGKRWHRIGWKDKNDEDTDLVYMNVIDPDYLNLLDIKILRGRNFSTEIPSDFSNALIVNESFEKWYGLENAVGEEIPAAPGAQIVGVLPDFYFNSLYVDVSPLILTLNFEIFSELETVMVSQGGVDLSFILVKLSGENMQSTIKQLRKTWEAEFPEATWTMKFVDEDVEEQYKDHLKWQRITSLATAVAILIALMGLIGLSAMQVARRTKEIGIRKVLGASLQNILDLLTREIVYIVLAANVIAIPIVYLIANKLLNSFAYHINIHPLFFIAAFGLILTVSIMASGVLSLRAAQVNPVSSLRHE